MACEHVPVGPGEPSDRVLPGLGPESGHIHLFHDVILDKDEHIALGFHVVIQRRRRYVQGAGEGGHGEPLVPAGLDQPQRCPGDRFLGQNPVQRSAGGATG